MNTLSGSNAVTENAVAEPRAGRIHPRAPSFAGPLNVTSRTSASHSLIRLPRLQINQKNAANRPVKCCESTKLKYRLRMNRIERHAAPRIREALEDTRIVAVQGARQVGKTTLVREIVTDLGGRLVSFDDEQMLALAKADPLGFLQHDDKVLAIDEIQLAPELVPALKYTVDRDPRPGRFLITGSADLLRLPAARDSLAGRVESIELHGFSQGELAGRKEAFIDRAFSGGAAFLSRKRRNPS